MDKERLLTVLNALKDDKGLLRVSLQDLAIKTGLSVSTIHRTINHLIEQGVLEVVQKGNRSRPTEYRLLRSAEDWSMDAIQVIDRIYQDLDYLRRELLRLRSELGRLREQNGTGQGL